MTEIKRTPHKVAYEPPEAGLGVRAHAEETVGPPQQRGLGFEEAGIAAAGDAWRARTRITWRPTDRGAAQRFCDAAVADTPTGRFEDATLEHDDGRLGLVSAGLCAFDRAMTALGDHASAQGPDRDERIAWAGLAAARLLFRHAERVSERCRMALRTPAEQTQASAWAKAGQSEVERFRATIPATLRASVESQKLRAAFENATASSVVEQGRFDALRKNGSVGQDLPRLATTTESGPQKNVVWIPAGLNHLQAAAALLVDALELLDTPAGREVFSRVERATVRASNKERLLKLAFDGECYVAELEIAATQEIPAGTSLVEAMKTATVAIRAQAEADELGPDEYNAAWRRWRNVHEHSVSLIVGVLRGSSAIN